MQASFHAPAVVFSHKHVVQSPDLADHCTSTIVLCSGCTRRRSNAMMRERPSALALWAPDKARQSDRSGGVAEIDHLASEIDPERRRPMQSLSRFSWTVRVYDQQQFSPVTVSRRQHGHPAHSGENHMPMAIKQTHWNK